MLKKNRLSVKQLEQNLHHIHFADNKELYLIGTAHVSASSVQLVEDTINKYKPDTVCIELDQQRYEQIRHKKKFENKDIIEIIKHKQLAFFIAQFLLASFQKKISEKTKSKPGMEFKKAITLAKKKKLRLILADRNIGITLKRAWRLTGFWQKIKFLANLFAYDSKEWEKINIEELKNMDAINTLVKKFGKLLPVAKKVLIDERDYYLAYEMRLNSGAVTVAVVGAGHVPGILKNLKKDLSPEIKEKITILPPESKTGRIISWLLPLSIIGLIVWGFFQGDRDLTSKTVLYWLVSCSILSGIGCMLSLAHPLTILSGIIGAPFAVLTPTIGIGFITGLVQALTMKPRIRDFQQIQERALKIHEWWQNRVTKIFVVFILSSAGASIGTFIALPALIKIFKA